MKDLSIFVDESGDFGEYAKHSPFYIITLILHDQSQDISGDIAKLRSEFINLGYEDVLQHSSQNRNRTIVIKPSVFMVGGFLLP